MADEARHASTTSQPPVQPFTPRNLVVLSDGTGNSAAKLFRTNVWRIYEALDLNCDDQIALYDNGVGTASFKPLAAIGGAFGYGLKRNVLDLYKFLCRNYKAAGGYEYDPRKPSEDDPTKHDHIFAFGFSRGAFTARVVAGLVASEGLIHHTETDEELDRLAAWAYRSYRTKRYRHQWGVKLLRGIRDGVLHLIQRKKPRYDIENNRKVPIDFLGVFDTVAAYGLPVDELTRGWDRWVWPMTPRDHSLHERVKFGRHAVAIDDQRQTFFPLLWDEDSEDETKYKKKFDHPDDRIKQVWFSGMHSNIGGGYADDALSLVPLCWMASEAVLHGLRFQPHMLDPTDSHLNLINRERHPAERVPAQWRERAASCAPMGDSRHGVAAYYRYHPRPIGRLCGFKDHSTDRNPDSKVTIERPRIHQSVFERIKDSRDNYAPFNLPEKYAVVTRDGEVLVGDKDGATPSTTPNPFEHSTQAESRVREQQSAWDEVWKRRVAYFLTVGATLLLLALPVVPEWLMPIRKTSHMAETIFGTVSGFAPGFATGLLDSYSDRPNWFLLVAALVGIFMLVGSRLKGKVNDRMGKVWARSDRNGLQAAPLEEIAPTPTNTIYKLRESPAYKGTFRFMSEKLWPNVFGVAIMLLVLALIVAVIPLRLAYQIASRMEDDPVEPQHWSFCAPAAAPDPGTPTLATAGFQEFGFYPDKICHPTGIELKKGHRYAIQIAIPVDLKDDATYKDAGSCGRIDAKTRAARLGLWHDASHEVTSTAGISGTATMALFTPFRRIWAANWFVPIAAIGTTVPERHYLTNPTTEFTATRDGALSLYVNDAALPSAADDNRRSVDWNEYYSNNTGGPARVRVTELDATASVESLQPLKPVSCSEQQAMQAKWFDK